MAYNSYNLEVLIRDLGKCHPIANWCFNNGFFLNMFKGEKRESLKWKAKKICSSEKRDARNSKDNKIRSRLLNRGWNC